MLVLEQGHLETLLFDDIGDMLDHERASPELVVKKRYVHDAGTRSWCEAENCTFVYAESVHTPMASGLAAYGNEVSAKAQAEKENGRLLAFDQLGAFRAQWRKDRHGR
jgi:nitrous oxide reductase accessory protein NosL